MIEKIRDGKNVYYVVVMNKRIVCIEETYQKALYKREIEIARCNKKVYK